MERGLGKNVFALLLFFSLAGFVFAASAFFPQSGNPENPSVLSLDNETPYGGFLGMVANFAPLTDYKYDFVGFGQPQLGPNTCCYCLADPLVAGSKQACGALNAGNYVENVPISGIGVTKCDSYATIRKKIVDNDARDHEYSKKISKDKCGTDLAATGKKNLPQKNCCVFLSKKDLPKGPDYETEKDKFFSANPSCTETLEADEQDFYANPEQFSQEHSCTDTITGNYAPNVPSAQRCCFCVYDDKATDDAQKLSGKCDDFFEGKTDILFEKQHGQGADPNECQVKEKIKLSEFSDQYMKDLQERYACNSAKIYHSEHGPVCKNIEKITRVCYGALNCDMSVQSNSCQSFASPVEAYELMKSIESIIGPKVTIKVAGHILNAYFEDNEQKCTMTQTLCITKGNASIIPGPCRPEGEKCSPANALPITCIYKTGRQSFQRCCPNQQYSGDGVKDILDIINFQGSFAEPGKSCGAPPAGHGDCSEPDSGGCKINGKEVGRDTRGYAICKYDNAPNGTACTDPKYFYNASDTKAPVGACVDGSCMQRRCNYNFLWFTSDKACYKEGQRYCTTDKGKARIERQSCEAYEGVLPRCYNQTIKECKQNEKCVEDPGPRCVPA